MTCVCSVDHLPRMPKALSLFDPQHHEMLGSWGKSTSLVNLVTEFDSLDLHSRTYKLSFDYYQSTHDTCPSHPSLHPNIFNK